MAMSAEKSAAATIDIRNLDAFSAPNASNANLRGVLVTETTHAADLGTGELFYSPEDLGSFTELRDAGKLAYVVYSYATPIAWATKEGTRTLSELRHSATTARHRAIVMRAWDL